MNKLEKRVLRQRREGGTFMEDTAFVKYVIGAIILLIIGIVTYLGRSNAQEKKLTHEVKPKLPQGRKELRYSKNANTKVIDIIDTLAKVYKQI